MLRLILFAALTLTLAEADAIKGKAVVIERSAEGEAEFVFEATLNPQPRCVASRARFELSARCTQLAEVAPVGSCDDRATCERKTNEMCKGAGYGEGVCKKGLTKAEVTEHADGSKTCSGGCCGTSDRGTTGGVALVMCPPARP